MLLGMFQEKLRGHDFLTVKEEEEPGVRSAYHHDGLPVVGGDGGARMEFPAGNFKFF